MENSQLVTNLQQATYPKPTSRAWVNGTAIWFVLYRRARVPVANRAAGDWVPVTRKQRKTAERAKMVWRVLDCRKETTFDS